MLSVRSVMTTAVIEEEGFLRSNGELHSLVTVMRSTKLIVVSLPHPENDTMVNPTSTEEQKKCRNLCVTTKASGGVGLIENQPSKLFHELSSTAL